MTTKEAVGHGPHSFLWSEQEYEPRELMEKFEHLLPFVAMVTQGYHGKNEPIESDEIYWLREIAHQKRVVCRDNSQEYYSIPLYYPEDVIPSQSNGVDGPMMSIEEMMNEGIYSFFKFEPGCCHSITKNADHYKHKELGTLEITESYDERLLIVHTVLSGASRESPSHEHPRGYNNVDGIFSKFTIIPLYMPIALAVAVGMSDTETENFHRTMYNFKKFVDTQPRKYDEFLKQVSDIMTFDEAPSGGDYEYIHFLQFIQANGEEQNSASDVYWTITDVPMSQPELESGAIQKRPSKAGDNISLKATLQNDDSRDYEEIPEKQKIPPNHPFSAFTPTLLAYREGPVALGVDVRPALEDLKDILRSGVAPKSTKVKAPLQQKVGMIKPKVVPRAPTAHHARIEYENVDIPTSDPPPRPERRIDRSKDDRNYVKFSFQQGKSQILNIPDTSKQMTMGKTISNAQSISIDMSDILSSKLNLKRVSSTKPDIAKTGIPPTEGVMQSEAWTKPVNNRESTRSVATRGTYTEKPKVMKKPQSKLLMTPPKELCLRNQGHQTSRDSQCQDVPNVLSDDIVSAANIPRDVSKFTVGDVARCLELLNMSKYVDVFVAQQIDGAALQHMNANTLQAQFGLNSLMATKLVMFAKKGWRPNV